MSKKAIHPDAVVVLRRLRTLREEQGMTQAQLATKAKLSTNYISSCERGRKNPSLLVLGRIATALGMSAAELLGAEPLDERGHKVAEVFHRLKPTMQRHVLRLMRAIAKEYEHT